MNGRWMVALLLLPLGCVSLDRFRQLEGENRALAAEKQRLEDDLYQMRNGQGAWEQRLAALQNENAQLKGDNQRLQDVARQAQATLDEMLAKATPQDLIISGPALPPKLNEALESFAEQHPDAIEYDPSQGVIRWKGDLLFALGSDVVVDSAKSTLRQFAQIIKSDAARDFEVLVVGHTDITPIKREVTLQRHPTNWHLSAHRAISVADFLIHEGYAPRNIGVAGYGEYRPVIKETSPDALSKNRRVEILILRQGALTKIAQAGTLAPLEDGRLALMMP